MVGLLHRKYTNIVTGEGPLLCFREHYQGVTTFGSTGPMRHSLEGFILCGLFDFWGPDVFYPLYNLGFIGGCADGGEINLRLWPHKATPACKHNRCHD